MSTFFAVILGILGCEMVLIVFFGFAEIFQMFLDDWLVWPIESMKDRERLEQQVSDLQSQIDKMKRNAEGCDGCEGTDDGGKDGNAERNGAADVGVTGGAQ